MNLSRLFALLVVCFSTLTLRHACLAQGSLTPPGPPAPTFKTLSQVEPRFPISDFQTNLTIPGSYYLTTNLFAGTNTNDGINIRTNINNITIDLNGFSIFSTNPASGTTSPVGVRISEATNIVVRNGQIYGFDRGVRAEGLFYGVVVENLHVHNMTRSGIEADGVAGNALQTVTIHDCIVEDVNATGEGASAAADGIVLLNCTGVVRNCVVRHLTPAGASGGTCITALTVTKTFIDNNCLAQATTGISITGGGTRVYYRNNLTAGCTTPFSSSGGVDRGGNF